MTRIKKLVKYLPNIHFEQNPTNLKEQKALHVC